MRFLGPLLLVLLQFVFWKLRLHDPGEIRQHWGALHDLYVEHYPMVSYSLQRMLAGELPMWNPHQLFGLPFLAVPHPAVLYPPHWPLLRAGVGASIELSVILHFALAALGIYGLARSLGASRAGAFAGSLGFV